MRFCEAVGTLDSRRYQSTAWADQQAGSLPRGRFDSGNIEGLTVGVVRQSPEFPESGCFLNNKNRKKGLKKINIEKSIDPLYVSKQDRC